MVARGGWSAAWLSLAVARSLPLGAPTPCCCGVQSSFSHVCSVFSMGFWVMILPIGVYALFTLPFYIYICWLFRNGGAVGF